MRRASGEANLKFIRAGSFVGIGAIAATIGFGAFVKRQRAEAEKPTLRIARESAPAISLIPSEVRAGEPPEVLLPARYKTRRNPVPAAAHIAVTGTVDGKPGTPAEFGKWVRFSCVNKGLPGARWPFAVVQSDSGLFLVFPAGYGAAPGQTEVIATLFTGEEVARWDVRLPQPKRVMRVSSTTNNLDMGIGVKATAEWGAPMISLDGALREHEALILSVNGHTFAEFPRPHETIVEDLPRIVPTNVPDAFGPAIDHVSLTVELCQLREISEEVSVRCRVVETAGGGKALLFPSPRQQVAPGVFLEFAPAAHQRDGQLGFTVRSNARVRRYALELVSPAASGLDIIPEFTGFPVAEPVVSSASPSVSVGPGEHVLRLKVDMTTLQQVKKQTVVVPVKHEEIVSPRSMMKPREPFRRSGQ